LASDKADQLLNFIAHGHLPEASLQAQELASALSEIPFRRSPYLSENRKKELLSAREDALSLNQVLSAGLETPISRAQAVYLAMPENIHHS
jgi:hypothetical protein